MAALTQMPQRFSAGTTLLFTRSLSDYSSFTYDLAVYFGGANIPGTPTSDGAGFDFVMSKVSTAALTPGTYVWRELATRHVSGEVTETARGTVTIDSNPTTQTAQQGLSYEERTLGVIEAALSGRLTKDLESYQISMGDGSMIAVNKIDTKTLELLRVKYSRAVARQKGRSGGLGKAHKYRFGGG